MTRRAARPLLVGKVQLRWYALALLPILGLGWLSLSNHIPGIFLPLVLFAFVFWLMSFVMAMIAKLRRPPETRK